MMRASSAPSAARTAGCPTASPFDSAPTRAPGASAARTASTRSTTTEKRVRHLIRGRPARAGDSRRVVAALAVGAVEGAELRARREQVEPQTDAQPARADRSVDDRFPQRPTVGARSARAPEPYRGCVGHDGKYVVASPNLKRRVVRATWYVVAVGWAVGCAGRGARVAEQPTPENPDSTIRAMLARSAADWNRIVLSGFSGVGCSAT